MTKNNLPILLGLFFMGLIAFLRPVTDVPADGMSTVTVMSYSQFTTAVRDGSIKNVFLGNSAARGIKEDGKTAVASVPDDPALAARLTDMGANVRIIHPEPANPFTGMLMSMIPLFLLALFWMWMIRRMSSQGGPMAFARNRARLSVPEEQTVTFKDVAGADEAREELKEIVEFLKEPARFSKMGGTIPRGVLLVGPPGTGKTLLAKAVAGEAGVPFFSISGSDFVEMFVGVGAGRVRSLFEEGRKHAPCIIFIDEIDAMGRHRGAGVGGGNDEREQTLNQMLVEMDGFEPNTGIILIAATNRPDVLDPALLRPGRFDRQVTVPNPDVTGRTRILEVHSRKVPLAEDVNLNIVARGTPGFSGADLKNLINEAALRAAFARRETVTAADLDAAKDKIMMGTERRSMKLSEAEIRMTAYHEAGHALVACSEEGCDPVHKATVIPRGRALGMVVSLPEAERSTMSLAKAHAYLAMCLAGRAAEAEVFGPENITNGAASDIRAVTNMARRMVTEWGFSETLGPISYGGEDAEVFLGHSLGRQRNNSEETARSIDSEVRNIVAVAAEKAMNIVKTRRDRLNAIAEALIERETLDGDEVRLLASGGTLPALPALPPVVRQRGSVPDSGFLNPGYA